MAKRQRDVALRGLERAEDLTAYWQKQLLELEDSSSEKADEIETKLKEAEAKLEKGKKELKEAEQKYEAKASVQAGPAQAGGACALQSLLLPLICTLHGRRVFSWGPPFCFLGSCSPLSKDSARR